MCLRYYADIGQITAGNFLKFQHPDGGYTDLTVFQRNRLYNEGNPSINRSYRFACPLDLPIFSFVADYDLHVYVFLRRKS